MLVVGDVKLLLKDFKEISSKQLNQVGLTPRDDAENCKLGFHLKCLFWAFQAVGLKIMILQLFFLCLFVALPLIPHSMSPEFSQFEPCAPEECVGCGKMN